MGLIFQQNLSLAVNIKDSPSPLKNLVSLIRDIRTIIQANNDDRQERAVTLLLAADTTRRTPVTPDSQTTAQVPAHGA